ncbi:AMP-binding protein [Pseudobutyrivibrio xylanivorans]|uniref:Long-chain acyl-CoA synthetase n=1 Tax=Pseudobutyrivibrio xylanivorans DSM 14809 TaxID=1123012 RepID=A0A1M6L602_PSEXY|nr:AMP-binding protein [Pseudobutyrivibrio xylanivorans]SHJ66668.1 long-chain acyl-CoA synthetase [Pseudobutyrivibrio xylanivorans DSM 14809]
MENLRTLWDDTASKFSELTAVRWLDKKAVCGATYGKLDDKITNIRKGLLATGYSEAHIAIIGESSLQWISSYLGIVTGTNVAVPLDALLPQKELIDLINRADCQVLFLSPKLISLAEPALQQCKKLKQIWLLQDSYEQNIPNAKIGTLSELMDLGKDKADTDGAAPDSIATIIFTSGTTGKSKGVMLTQKNLFDNVKNVDYEEAPGCVMMSVLPIHHAYCLVMDWLKGFSLGAIVCINDSLMHMVRNISIFRPKVILMVPLMIESIYKRLSSLTELSDEMIYETVFGGNLKIIFTGGAHLDPFYIDEFKKYGIDIYEGYGMSECSPVITTNTVDNHKPGSIGKPLANVQIKFVDGEILVKGTSVMKGYYNMPEETSATLEGGWLHTGDKGYLDKDGYLFINGRVKNLIILSNGENVSPEEIENKLGLCPLIAEVIITGNNTGLTANIYPDDDYAQRQCLNPLDINKELQDYIDKYNYGQPSYRHITNLVVRTDPFIRNTTGKIKRNDPSILHEGQNAV